MLLSKLKSVAALVLLCAGTGLFFSNSAVAAPVPKPKPDEKKDDKSDATFTAIVIECAGVVTITQTGKEDVQPADATTGQHHIDKGVLYLSGASNFTVEVKELKSIEVKGVSMVKAKDLKAKALTINVSTAGSATLDGTVDEQTITVDGSGRMNGENLKGKSGTVSASGAGTATVNVSDKLTASAKGVAEVKYLGAPKVEQTTADLGKITQQEAKRDDGK